MKRWNNQKITNIALVVLVIMNIGLMVALVLGPPPPPSPEQMTQRVVRALDLEPDQEKRFKELERVHFDQTKVLVDSMRDLRNSLVAQVDAPPTITEPIALKIGDLDGRLTLLLVRHYEALAAELEPAQQAELKRMFERRFLRPRLPKRKR